MKKYVIVKDKGVFEKSDHQIYRNILTHEKENLNDEEIIREICSQKDVMELLERIEFILTIQAPNAKVYEEFYQEAMSKYDEVEWIKVIKTEYMRRKMHKSFPFEKNYSHLAKLYLYSEMSLLLNIPYESVEQYITDYIHENEWDEDL